MKSKISIWDCRRAIDIAGGGIDIAGGLPLTIRGDLFAGPGPHPVGRWFPETAVLITQIEVKQGRWVCGNISFTRHGQEHLTKLARDIIANNERLYASQQLDESDPRSPRKRQPAAGRKGTFRPYQPPEPQQRERSHPQGP